MKTGLYPARARTALCLAVFAVLVVGVIPLWLVCLPFGLRDPLFRYGRWIALVLQRIVGVRLEVSGLEHAQGNGPRVFMANHVSLIDGPLAVLAIPEFSRVIMKRSIFSIPVAGPAMRYTGFVPVDRKKAHGGIESIEEASAIMKKRGYSFLIFPEGTRSRDGRLQRFKRGGFVLALSASAPIVPMTIRGSFELMPRNARVCRPGTVRIEFHEPIPIDGHTHENMMELIDKVKASIGGEAVRKA